MLIDERRPIARKPHMCDAYFWIVELYEDGLFEYQDLRKIVRMHRQKGVIQPGQRYIYQVQISEGEFCIFKADIEMDSICRKYKLYPDD